ncbi:alternative oxidase [Neolentinus lepideus HHB14362 ss-1]|uniref:Alternative oxidase n=1 Tax=Neolentinus lepideus HHB14362 ss-1 TaxID=1314782 RepID=A0A165LTE4_9AGAM|nr:alternative oxidase [Neolentinus lepideus HHB14362 ss-1]
MVHMVLVSTLPRASGVALGPIFACSARRTFFTSSSRLNSLKTKKANEESGTGTEGFHRRDLATETPADLPTVSKVVGGNAVKGDWVLFHPVYTADELKAVEIVHNKATTFSDKIAHGLVTYTRKLFDLVSGYKHQEHVPSNATLEELQKKGYIMNENQWFNRILFLETIAGVPGMVAATVRHLRSLRLMQRDSGWIHTLLEEAENERMHLMTFMALKKPSIFLRMLVLGAQGVYYNMFFLGYLISPKLCHRFVGYLEEEAVITYTRCIQEIEAGRLPAWENEPAPEIAKDYWRLKPDAKLLDVLYAVRSDESTHRFVNHSLANLNLKTDTNPFALREPDMHVKGRKVAFERDEAAQYVEESHRMLSERRTE